MKRKINGVFLAIGFACLVCVAVLVACGVADIAELWVNYVGLVCLLIVFVCLNAIFKKYTDLEEAISCIRRTRRAIAAINISKDVSYVKRFSIHNQLNNSELLLEDLIARREWYSLKDNLSELGAIKERYKASDSMKLSMDKETVSAELAVLDKLLEELKAAE